MKIFDRYETFELLKVSKKSNSHWYKYKWRPIFNHTYKIFYRNYYKSYGLGFNLWRLDSEAYSSFVYGIYYKAFHIEFVLPIGAIEFWIRWDFRRKRQKIEEEIAKEDSQIKFETVEFKEPIYSESLMVKVSRDELKKKFGE